MKSKFIFLIVALFFSINISFGNPGEIYLVPDSIQGTVTFAVLKINPIQFLLNEIPVSFELFLPKEWSVQFQLGYIFPANEASFRRILFESNGTNADASSEGLLSYRNSPFNNHGISVKFELRKYGKYFYHGGQLMYKNCFYKNTVFNVYRGGITLNQTENKFSSIIGLGYVIGRQSDKKNVILDWYAAVGLRVRFMSVTTLEIENPVHSQSTSYPNSTENFTSVYPFLNLGFRIGFRFYKTVMV
jgi:hypothetical protein